jgi:hypothetical protein
MENRKNPQPNRHSDPNILGRPSSTDDDPYEPLRFVPAVPTQLANVETPVAPLGFSEQPFLLPINYARKLHDVICWPKGVRVCDKEWTPGNARFKVIVDASVERYRRASGRRQKIEICKEAVEAVRCAGGSFIRYIPPPTSSLILVASSQSQEAYIPDDNSNAQATLASLSSTIQGGRWMDIGNLKAREKASHAIRQEINKMRKRRASSLPTTSHAADAAAVSSPLPPLSSPSSSPGSQSSGLSGVAFTMLQHESKMAVQDGLWTSTTMAGPLAHTVAQHDSLATRDDESHWDWEDAKTLAALDGDAKGIQADLTNLWDDDTTDTPAFPGFRNRDTS